MHPRLIPFATGYGDDVPHVPRTPHPQEMR
jgi:hypothetical protein